MLTRIYEQIKACVIFGRDIKMKPLWFVWNNKRYTINDITYTWLCKEGNDLLYFFSVTDGSTLFELSYSTKTLVWTLTAIETE